MLVHTDTQRALALIRQHPPHAVMLTGEEGSGKRHAAMKLAADLLGTSLDNYPFFLLLEPAGKAITIDQIRELQRFVRLKTTGSGLVRRIAILVEAHSMTDEAQNALLKLLEEPPSDTVLILTAQNGTKLKPTIRSRVQNVHVRPITKQQAESYATGLNQAEQVEKAYSLSKGDSGLFEALLGGDQEHPLAGAINTAKKLLTSSVFDRLARVDEIAKDRQRMADLLIALKRIASEAFKQAAAKGDNKLKARWLKSLESIYDCEAQVAGNANAKLLLTDLFLNI